MQTICKRFQRDHCNYFDKHGGRAHKRRKNNQRNKFLLRIVIWNVLHRLIQTRKCHIPANDRIGTDGHLRAEWTKTYFRNFVQRPKPCPKFTLFILSVSMLIVPNGLLLLLAENTVYTQIVNSNKRNFCSFWTVCVFRCWLFDFTLEIFVSELTKERERESLTAHTKHNDTNDRHSACERAHSYPIAMAMCDYASEHDADCECR